MRRYSYIVLFFAISILMVACSAHKNTAKSRFWQSFTAKYNTYYNGSLAYTDGTLEKEKGHNDTSEYDNILSSLTKEIERIL